MGNTIKNMMTVDIEDWYMDLDISRWPSFEDRVVLNTQHILDIFDKSKVKATFFVLGYVAEKFPELIMEIKDKGHEIGTHGYSHKSAMKQTPVEFEDDLLKSVSVIEGITNDKIMGHRACQFSLVEETSWMIDILKKNNFKYDSSIFPVNTHLYGVHDAPLYPYRISSQNIKVDMEVDFHEFPLSIYRTPIIRKNIPVAGGFYLRFFPYYFIKYALRKINKMGQPAICYIHPWELDLKQPRINELRWYHYHKLDSTERKFEKLLEDFEFGAIRDAWEFE